VPRRFLNHFPKYGRSRAVASSARCGLATAKRFGAPGSAWRMMVSFFTLAGTEHSWCDCPLPADTAHRPRGRLHARQDAYGGERCCQRTGGAAAVSTAAVGDATRRVSVSIWLGVVERQPLALHAVLPPLEAGARIGRRDLSGVSIVNELRRALGLRRSSTRRATSGGYRGGAAAGRWHRLGCPLYLPALQERRRPPDHALLIALPRASPLQQSEACRDPTGARPGRQTATTHTGMRVPKMMGNAVHGPGNARQDHRVLFD
jgi:hypothetical protein